MATAHAVAKAMLVSHLLRENRQLQADIDSVAQRVLRQRRQLIVCLRGKKRFRNIKMSARFGIQCRATTHTHSKQIIGYAALSL